jgi:hypothetical protein
VGVGVTVTITAEAGVAVTVTVGADVGTGVGVDVMTGATQPLKSIAARITDMSKNRFIVAPFV